jgi:DoxX-like family
MQTTTQIETSKGRLWTGRILTGFSAAFLLLDAIMKLFKPAFVVTAFAQSGWPADLCVPLGVILLTCTVLYLIPRTAVLGAILLTGYLGGAVATNLRLHNPLFSHTLFPVYVGVMIWAGLVLRVPALRGFVSVVN